MVGGDSNHGPHITEADALANDTLSRLKYCIFSLFNILYFHNPNYSLFRTCPSLKQKLGKFKSSCLGMGKLHGQCRKSVCVGGGVQWSPAQYALNHGRSHLETSKILLILATNVITTKVNCI